LLELAIVPLWDDVPWLADELSDVPVVAGDVLDGLVLDGD